MTIASAVAVAVFASSVFADGEPQALQMRNDEVRDGIVAAVDAAARENEALQSRLSKRRSLAEYSCLARHGANGSVVWTKAFQRALDENEVVVVPASATPYLVDATLVVPSNRRIEAEGATVRLATDTRTLMLRNTSVKDGTLEPVPRGTRDCNIAIRGGVWEDWCSRRRGYGATGRMNDGPRELGNFFGVSALFYFGNCDHVSVTGATFRHAGSFAVQCGDGDAFRFENITFDRCYADGLHLNGNLTRVLARNIRGSVGDDLVALNAYDWLRSSVNFGPQREILCEDLDIADSYPAIRIHPVRYRYPDGTVVDCSVERVVFRRIRGVSTFKIYLQTPRYRIGDKPEWGEVGSGGDLFFEDMEIDLDGPPDRIGQYMTHDPLRGHFAAFEIGANLSSVTIRNVAVRFFTDKWPQSHLVTVGPKSCVIGDPPVEVFDPYVSCSVGRLTLENVRVIGKPPTELVREISFVDINHDGRSTGIGRIAKLVDDAWKVHRE